MQIICRGSKLWQLSACSVIAYKQVNAQKEKLSGVHASSRKPTRKVCDENESTIRKKRRARKNVIDGRGEIIRRLWKGHVMDINKPQVNDF